MMYILDPGKPGFIDKLINPNFAKLESLANQPTQTVIPPTGIDSRQRQNLIRDRNRKKYPDIAKVIDQLKAIFGEDQIQVIAITNKPKSKEISIL